MWVIWKLDGVGPVDNRPSTDKLHHFVRKKEKKMTFDTSHVTGDTWCDTWRDTWHILSNFSSLALKVCDLWYYEYWEEKDDSLNELMN